MPRVLLRGFPLLSTIYDLVNNYLNKNENNVEKYKNILHTNKYGNFFIKNKNFNRNNTNVIINDPFTEQKTIKTLKEFGNPTKLSKYLSKTYIFTIKYIYITELYYGPSLCLDIIEVEC